MQRTVWNAVNVATGLLIVMMVGCAKPPADQATGSQTPNGAKYVLQTEPAGAKGIADAVKQVKNDEEVVVVGRIGGAVDPWVDGLAAFSIVDTSLKPCTQTSESCPTPWDYCCELDALPHSTATIKVVDAQGQALSADPRQLFGLKELQTVVVHGKAQKDADDNLVVLADGIYIRK